MDLMTPEENDEFNRIERESATVRQEAIQASLWRKRHRLDEIDLLTNIVRDMSKRITELEEQLVRVDTLPVTTPTNSTKIEAALAQPEQEGGVCGRCGGWVSDPVITQPEQEPVAWMYPDALCDRACLYLCTKGFTQFPECATTPPQRKPLTDEQIKELIADDIGMLSVHGGVWRVCMDVARAIEAAHGIKE